MRPLSALLPLLATCTTGANATSAPQTDDGPVVVELFTSQGCSSCPPAEAVVNQIARTGHVSGRAVVPLAFHVDYWDDLGWSDPYATRAWTERQQAYARALDGRVYTPEIVVAGRVGMVGSRSSEVALAITNAPRVAALDAHASWDSAHVSVTATAPADADVWVAVWEDHTSTKVLRGENEGTTLPGERVVRKLERVAAAGKTATITVAIDSGWRAGGAVAFAQAGDRHIASARLLPR